ncbi:MAG TPA: tetratricopeptide repeat protein, partial [Candidatus Sulfopaludibacter sp.]|nr:tetratricopeptide repeat protein [Candidatus Sulfopaludibacter sp.]
GYRLLHTNPPAATAPANPAVKQIAVLPFQVAAEADTVRSTADGVSDVLTSGLANIEGIAVVPAADIRRRNITAPEAARKFYGANLVVTGTAQQAGDQVEFTINLLDTVKAVTLDSRKFLYDPKNPLVSRDQIVTQTVRMMKLELPPAALTAIKAGDTNTPDAYSAYLEGRGFLARYDLPGNIDRAIAAFKKATKQDANYALAYAGLAEAYWRKARSSGDLQALTLANQNAEYAVGLDPNMAILHSVLGSVYTDRGKPEDAVREFQKAMELAPNNAEAPRQLAEVYKTQGRVAEAEALFLRSTKARPTDWYGHLLLGIFYYERERYPQAEAELNQAKSLTPDNDMVRLDLGTVYRMHGRYREAVEEFQQSLRIRPAASTFAALGGAYYYEHRFAEAVSALEAAIDLDSNDYRYWGNLGIYYRRTPGNEAKSTAALTKALEMATRFAGTKKSDMNVRADIAEYRARLGDTRGAIAEIDRIPAASRPPLTARLALVYQIAGDRAKAVAVIKANLKSPESLNQIKDDPDLSELWPDVKPG